MSISLRQMLSEKIELYKREEPNFERMAAPFNSKIEHRPVWLVLPKTTSHIQEVIQLCRELDFRIGLRGAGFGAHPGMCPQEEVLINTHYLDSLKINQEKLKAQVQAGVTVGQLDKQTTSYQLAAVAPRFSSLNIVGVCLGGGTGLLSRSHGFAASNIKRAKLVTANGELVIADKENNPELFWALCGAGQNNFGVVTELEINLHPIPSRVWGGTLSWSLDYSPRIVAGLSAIFDDLGDNILLDLRMTTEGSHGLVEILGFYLGDEIRGRDAFQKISLLAPKPHRDDGVTNYLELQQHFRIPQGRRFFHLWHHGFIKMGMEARFVSHLLSLMLEHQDLNLRFKLEPIGDKLLTPECLRQSPQSKFLYVGTGIWQTPEQGESIQAWFDSAEKILSSMVTGFGHPNYHDFNVKSPLTYYFGDHGKQLRGLKKQWDPEGLFLGLLHPEYSQSTEGETTYL